jgi:DNA-binding LytR/AlgR family response regulator
VRIHRSALVNVEHIREITPLFNKTTSPSSATASSSP